MGLCVDEERSRRKIGEVTVAGPLRSWVGVKAHRYRGGKIRTYFARFETESAEELQ
jgi:hypothetical protein